MRLKLLLRFRQLRWREPFREATDKEALEEEVTDVRNGESDDAEESEAEERTMGREGSEEGREGR